MSDSERSRTRMYGTDDDDGEEEADEEGVVGDGMETSTCARETVGSSSVAKGEDGEGECLELILALINGRGTGSGLREWRVERSVYSLVVRPASSSRSLYAYIMRPPASASDRSSLLEEM